MEKVISPEESSSTATRSPRSNLLEKMATITQDDGTKIDLVPGEIYYDFSGHEKKTWFKCNQVGDQPQFVIYHGTWLLEDASVRVSNSYGLPLLYLGFSLNQEEMPVEPDKISFSAKPTKKFFYFLAESQIIGLEADFTYVKVDNFIRLWPNNEKRLHKNIY